MILDSHLFLRFLSAGFLARVEVRPFPGSEREDAGGQGGDECGRSALTLLQPRRDWRQLQHRLHHFRREIDARGNVRQDHPYFRHRRLAGGFFSRDKSMSSVYMSLCLSVSRIAVKFFVFLAY